MPNGRAVIAYGGNLGEVRSNINAALELIAAHPAIELVSKSSLYQSMALTPGGIDPSKPRYLNGVAILDTSLKPKQLLRFLNEVENHFGRIRLQRWASRTLDIDIITFGDLFVEKKTLVIPHPRAKDRAFVLVPWAEIDPTAVLPGAGSVAELARPLSGEVWRSE
ncbi:MAG: 2-amino-4-hydroxy-6-hydroxymethyldihydropteridine diphosphokinase [Actinomycetota bacterium]|jgi:2-amino-4-hydroxy-6-hydroxymethyldihydropteridine diphosphokinase